MTYKGSQINKQTLDPTLQQEITDTTTKANNSWQLRKYNDTSVSNLGAWTAERSLFIRDTDWKATGNVEQLDLYLPFGGAFSGLIKATYTSFWGGSDANGGATVLYRIGNYTNQGTGTRLNDYVLETITPDFARDYYIHQPYIDASNGTVTLIVQKSPFANNPFVVKLELQGMITGGKDAFTVMYETAWVIYDKGSPSHNGYPWTPQVSRIPTGAQTRFWDTSMWNDIIDGRKHVVDGVAHNLANFSPEQFRYALEKLLVFNMGTFKCFLPSGDLGLTNIMDIYGILTTIKPWTDESGGALKQRFETSDAIFKRYQINNTTWSPWVCIQSKDVDILKLFQSASDVKNNVAQAITDKGVPTSPDATGAQMAANIRAIPSGSSRSGTTSSSASPITFSYVNNSTVSLPYVEIVGLPFSPKMILFQASTGGGNMTMTLYTSFADTNGYAGTSKIFLQNMSVFSNSPNHNLQTVPIPNGLRIPVTSASNTYYWTAIG